MGVDSQYFFIDLERATPLYNQIQENITELVEVGILSDGEMLPSERELSQMYNVNRLTVRRAIDQLVIAGLVRKQRGVGNFIQRAPELKPSVQGFSQRMHEAGMKPSSRLLSARVMKLPLTVTHQLNLKIGELGARLERLRMADEEPFMIEVSYLPLRRFPDLLEHDFEVGSLYDILASQYGVQVAEVSQSFEPTLLNEHEAEHFGLKVGAPAMLVRVKAFDLNREPVELGKSVIRGDRCRFYLRLTTQHPIVS